MPTAGDELPAEGVAAQVGDHAPREFMAARAVLVADLDGLVTRAQVAGGCARA
ncbi:hypothetical protein [Streptomyces olivochromogenes]|uniref:hypothetical protein n=1 Tax=Streptomyces olivochromogenes TaxID=1963 RepID=UPI0036C130E7